MAQLGGRAGHGRRAVSGLARKSHPGRACRGLRMLLKLEGGQGVV